MRYVVGVRVDIIVSFDWVEFENSDQLVTNLDMQAALGRVTPPLWKSVRRVARICALGYTSG